MSNHSQNYLLLVDTEGQPRMSTSSNLIFAREEAEKAHKQFSCPVKIYSLVEIVGGKLWHYLVKNSTGSVVLDSRLQKNFEGYATEIGARWVAEQAAKDIKLQNYEIIII